MPESWDDVKARHAAMRAAERRRRRRIGWAVAAVVVLVAAAAALWWWRPWDDGSSPRAGTAGRADQQRTVQELVALGLPVYRGGGEARVVALTFDGGPGAATDPLLGLLQRNRARATFFLAGSNIGLWPGTVARQVARGAVGGMTWSGRDLADASPAVTRAEIVRGQQAVARAAGRPTRLFRPPDGVRTAAADRVVRRQGLLQVLWDVDSRDVSGAGPAAVLGRLKRRVHPGAIVLLHENHPETLSVLAGLLPWLRRQGYRTVTVPELLALDPPSEDRLRADARARAGQRAAGGAG